MMPNRKDQMVTSEPMLKPLFTTKFSRVTISAHCILVASYGQEANINLQRLQSAQITQKVKGPKQEIFQEKRLTMIVHVSNYTDG